MRFFRLPKTPEEADKFYANTTTIMSVFSLIMVAFFIALIISQYNTLPKFFFLMVGIILGIELQTRLDKKRIDALNGLVDSYKKMTDDILKWMKEAADKAEAKKKASRK